MKKILFLFCCLIPLGSIAQMKLFKGFIKSIDEGETIEQIQVKDLQTGKFTYTDSKGYFEIYTQAQHTLEISSTRIKTQNLIVKLEMFKAIQNLYVKVESVELKETVVNAQTPYQEDSAARYELYKQTLEREKPAITIDKPKAGNPIVAHGIVTSMLQNVSKKSKNKANFKKQHSLWEQQQFIDTRYTKEKVQLLTNLSGDTLAWFINTFPMPYAMAVNSSDSEISVWIRNNLFDWKANEAAYIKRLQLDINQE